MQYKIHECGLGVTSHTVRVRSLAVIRYQHITHSTPSTMPHKYHTPNTRQHITHNTTMPHYNHTRHTTNLIHQTPDNTQNTSNATQKSYQTHNKYYTLTPDNTPIAHQTKIIKWINLMVNIQIQQWPNITWGCCCVSLTTHLTYVVRNQQGTCLIIHYIIDIFIKRWNINSYMYTYLLYSVNKTTINRLNVK